MPTSTPSYLRYAPDIETQHPDEAGAIEGIIAAMTEQSEIVPTEATTPFGRPTPRAPALQSAS